MERVYRSHPLSTSTLLALVPLDATLLPQSPEEAMATASTPTPDPHVEDVHSDNSVAPPADALFTFFTRPCPVESDLVSLYSQSPQLCPSSNCTLTCQMDDARAAAAAQWAPMSPQSRPSLMASPRCTRASSRHCRLDCCSTAGSCHRCKRRPVLGTLLACVSPHCNLKFCTTCLNRNHAFRVVTVMPSGRIHCPRCLQICTCKTCISRNKRQVSTSANPQQQQLPSSETAASVVNLSQHSTITQSPQVVIPLELYERLVQTATQHVGVQARPLL